MAIFGRFRPRPVRAARAAVTGRNDRQEEVAQAREHLEHFVRTRVGVEAYLEPATAVMPPTVLLVASSGEWTRRRIGDPRLVRRLAEGLHVPVYDVQLVGYPPRMRRWNEQRRTEGPAGP